MPNKKPDESLEPSNTSRSLGVALGVQDFMFIAGFLLLAVGLVPTFGWAITAAVLGAVLVVTVWLMQFAA